MDNRRMVFHLLTSGGRNRGPGLDVKLFMTPYSSGRQMGPYSNTSSILRVSLTTRIPYSDYARSCD